MPRSLGARLVIVAVLLVAVAAALIGTATTLVMRSNLTSELDRDVHAALGRSRGPDGHGGPFRLPGDGGPDGEILGQSVGTVTAELPDNGQPSGDVLADSDRGWAAVTSLTTTQLTALEALPADGRARTVELPSLGSYRVVVAELDSGDRVAAGLPLAEVDATIGDLVRLEVLATLAAVIAAALAGTALVRRQLRPLTDVVATAHAVVAQPLDRGDVGALARVPDHLTDPDTEVGQVGQALNTLLAHVESSLDARHRSEQQVRQFVADASHELRTPLTTIAGYTELARRRQDPEATATALAKVEEEAARMTALVEDLLLLARLDSGRPLAQEPVDLTRLLLEAVADARVLAPDHHWHLELPEDAVPVEVTGDEARLHQVATNLLTNARKYTPAGTTVTVAVRPDGFEVRDDGPGLPPDLLPVAFERFSRGDASRHREGGIGLGLALVRAIVEAHGGTVTLTSEPGDTRIEVTLPIG